MNAFDPLNGSKSHAINRHLQALAFNLIAVTWGQCVVFNELTTTIDADVILFTSSLTILANMRRLALWALHLSCPQFIPSLCNASKIRSVYPGFMAVLVVVS